MAQRGTKVNRPFSILVANLSGQFDGNGKPIPTRMGFTQQLVNNNPNQLQMGLLTGAPAPATATIVVIDNDFTTGAAKLTIGEFELESGIHYTPGGTLNATAIALAAAINNLPEYTAPIPGAATVDVSGPTGPDGGFIEFDVYYEGTKTNFTLAPTTGFFDDGAPVVGSPIIF